MATKKGLVERLADPYGTILCAEGYLFEFESRGYLKAGGFVPEVVLEHPELVEQLHREFVHAGSDVVLAFTYYGHRHKMRVIGREDELEKLNRQALRIAKKVADDTGTLMAGNICNSSFFKPGDAEKEKEAYEQKKEQVIWAVEEGADFIVGETFDSYAEASIALRAILENGKGVPAVITFSQHKGGLVDGLSWASACRRLEEEGASVVGVNCTSGPQTTLDNLRPIREACKGPVAALPVLYRTTKERPCMQALRDIENPDESAFPERLEPWLCSRRQVTAFGAATQQLGVSYVGLCCGNRAAYTRALAESIGRKPPASRYSPDMSMHYSRKKDDQHDFVSQRFKNLYK